MTFVALCMLWSVVAAPPCNRAVDVTLVGEDATRAWVRAPVVEQLARVDEPACFSASETLTLATVVYPPPNAQPRIRVWVDVSRADRATVYIVDKGWERVLVRHVQFVGEIDEVARDEISHIVSSSVAALVEGAQLGITRERAAVQFDIAPPVALKPSPNRPNVTPSPVEPVAVASAPRRTPLRLSVGGGYDVAGWQTRGAPQHGPFIDIGLSSFVRPTVRIGGRATGRYFVPTSIRRDDLGARISGGAVRLELPVAISVRGTAALLIAPHVGMELTRVDPIAFNRQVDAFEARTDPAPTFGLRLGPVFELGASGLVAEVLLGVRVSSVDRGYIARDTNVTIFRPWRIRPGLSVGVRWAARRSKHRLGRATGAL